MKPQLSSRRRRGSDDVIIESLAFNELRAYNAGLLERLGALIADHCDCARCAQCSQCVRCVHEPVCGHGQSPGD